MRVKKNYLYTFLLTLLFTVATYSQETNAKSADQEITIEGLTIYPNPVNTGKIYISSKLGLEKKIEVFDVLGKKVFEITTASKEINISNLNAGVYILKIKEAEASATRKLIIN